MFENDGFLFDYEDPTPDYDQWENEQVFQDREFEDKDYDDDEEPTIPWQEYEEFEFDEDE